MIRLFVEKMRRGRKMLSDWQSDVTNNISVRVKSSVFCFESFTWFSIHI